MKTHFNLPSIYESLVTDPADCILVNRENF